MQQNGADIDEKYAYMRYDPYASFHIAPMTESAKLRLIRSMEEWKIRALERDGKAVS